MRGHPQSQLHYPLREELHRLTHNHTHKLSSHAKPTHSWVCQACTETKKENAKPVSSTIELYTSQLETISIGTHITYNTQHKECPLLCYTVPSVPLSFSDIQCAHIKVQYIEPLESISFIGFIIHSFFWSLSLLQIPFELLNYVPTKFPMKLNLQAHESKIFHGFLVIKMT